MTVLIANHLTRRADGEDRAKWCTGLEEEAHMMLRFDAGGRTIEEGRVNPDRELIISKDRDSPCGFGIKVRQEGVRFVEVDETRNGQDAPPEARRDARDGLD